MIESLRNYDEKYQGLLRLGAPLDDKGDVLSACPSWEGAPKVRKAARAAADDIEGKRKMSTVAENTEDPVVMERRLKRRFALLALEQRFPSLLQTPVVHDRVALWKTCVQRVGASVPVTVLDFGVYQGRSTKFWATHFTNPDSRFHGFDSFEGLPRDWTRTMPKGTFSTQGQMPQIDDTRVSFHPGWIQNTLPGFLESADLKGHETLIAHVDTDIYSAALFILTTLWHYFDRFFVVFDEFGVDENLAFANFSEAYPVNIEFFCHTMNQYKMPAQVFGSVAKTEYK